MFRQFRSLLVTVVALALVGAAWVMFAPTFLGGSVSYLTIVGTSMQPMLEKGDLAVIRAAEDYRTGDVVVYTSEENPDARILHRIIEQKGAKFVLKGDHNTWADSFMPTEERIQGKLWFRVPKAGLVFAALRSPLRAAMLAAATGSLVLGGVGGVAGRRRRHNVGPGGPRPKSGGGGNGGGMGVLGPGGQMILAGCALAALGFAVLGGLAHRTPAMRHTTTDINYQHSGEFSYRGDAAGGSVYQSGVVETGEPIFLKLTRELQVDYRYELTSELPHEAGGTARMVAELSDTTGWRREFELQPETSFEGDKLVVSGVLDLEQISAVARQLEVETGVRRETFILSVTPYLDITGAVAAQPFEDEIAPSLRFSMDALQMRIIKDPPLASGDPIVDPIKPTQTNTVERSTVEPRSLTFAALSLDVGLARTIALWGAVVSFAGLAIAGALTLLALRADEAGRIRSRYGDRMVDVKSMRTGPNDSRVEVESMANLARLAERYESLILHLTEGERHSFVVQTADITYWYEAQGADDASPPAPIRQAAA